MQELEITLLGNPQIKFHGTSQPLSLPSKGQALVYFLAINRLPVSRPYLAGLLWSEQPEEEARRNLRVLLNTLQGFLPMLLNATRLDISLNPDVFQTDLETFLQSIRGTDNDQRLNCLSLYRGDLLAGFYLRGAPLFDEWIAIERERLRQVALAAFKEASRQAFSQGRPQHGIAFAQKVLAIESWDEDTHYQLIQHYAAIGQISVAVRQYERYREVLAQEFGLEPAPRLRQLHNDVRRSQAVPTSQALPVHNLPTALTPFLGREAELAQLEELVERNDCRLLTLAGPGGTGKTRLALMLAQRILHKQPALFPSGLHFVTLAGIDTLDGLWSMVATSIGLELQAKPRLDEQVIRFLQQRCSLLLLDNFEQLEEQSGELVKLLTQANDIKLLITSRLALGLHEEWVFEVRGLTINDSVDNDAARLFLQVAQRVSLNFNLVGEWSHVQKICRLVNGLPLGIVLAASWMRTMPAREIAALVERSQAELSTSFQNFPDRHTSLTAVFETSWALMSPDEQQALAGLSIFPADFDRSAAEAIAQTTPRVLSRLVNESMVQRNPAERYYLHPFIRECATTKAVDIQALRQAHGKYYAGFLTTRTADITYARPSVLEQAGDEISNLRQMWRWAVDTKGADILSACAPGLAGLCDQRGWLQEGVELLQQAMQALDEHAVDRAVVGVFTGRLQFRIGNFSQARDLLQASLDTMDAFPDAFNPSLIGHAKNYLALVQRDLGYVNEAMTLFAESEALFQSAQDETGQATVLVNQSGLYLRQSKHSLAHEVGQQALTLFRKLNEPGLWVTPLANMGAIHVEMGLLDEAQGYFEEALKYSEALHLQVMTASLKNHLGTLAIHRSDFIQAERYLRQALAQTESMGVLENTARLCNDLGAMYERQGNLSEALPFFKKALTINQGTGNTFSIIINLNNIGFLQRRLGQIEEAGRMHWQALEMAYDLAADSLALDAIIGLGAVMLQSGLTEKAMGCFAFVSQHPEADRQTKEELDSVLRQSGISPESLEGIPPLAANLTEMTVRLSPEKN